MEEEDSSSSPPSFPPSITYQNDAGDDDENISSLTESQHKLLALLPIFPVFLSLIGSSVIVYLVLFQKQKIISNSRSRTRKKKNSSYRRIMLGLSICDIIWLLQVPLQPFLLPTETSQRPWAFGNDATCTLNGFMVQFGLISTWSYNGFLSYYYLLTVRFGWKEERFAQKVEPFIHIFSVGFPLVTGIVCGVMGMYHELDLEPQCWIKDYPLNAICGPPTANDVAMHKDPEVKCKGKWIGWVVGGWVGLWVILSLAVNNTLLYRHVRWTIAKSKRFVFERRISSLSASDSDIDNINRNNNKTKCGTGNQRRTRDSEGLDPHARRVRAVAVQAFLYVGGFFVTSVLVIVVRNFEALKFNQSDAEMLFPILVLHQLLAPLQGFFNMLVYIRPRYLRVRDQYPEESRWWSLRRALWGETIKPRQPPTSSTSSKREVISWSEKLHQEHPSTIFSITASCLNSAESSRNFAPMAASSTFLAEDRLENKSVDTIIEETKEEEA